MPKVINALVQLDNNPLTMDQDVKLGGYGGSYQKISMPPIKP